LRQRGSLTVWFTDKAVAAWGAVPRTILSGRTGIQHSLGGERIGIVARTSEEAKGWGNSRQQRMQACKPSLLYAPAAVLSEHPADVASHLALGPSARPSEPNAVRFGTDRTNRQALVTPGQNDPIAILSDGRRAF
jgi:hypothetical protein